MFAHLRAAAPRAAAQAERTRAFTQAFTQCIHALLLLAWSAPDGGGGGAPLSSGGGGGSARSQALRLARAPLTEGPARAWVEALLRGARCLPLGRRSGGGGVRWGGLDGWRGSVDRRAARKRLAWREQVGALMAAVAHRAEERL